MRSSIELPIARGGHCDAAFSKVADVFDEWARRDPLPGMAAAVCYRGAITVDLWAGYADADARKPWDENTIVCMMSVAKGVAALCLHVIADKGLVDIDSPVARYWPEFARNGKSSILVRHVLDHSAGLPCVETGVGGAAALDEDSMTLALEHAAPLAPPGQQHAYHAVTVGYLIGAIVRRVTGLSIGEFFDREIASVHGLDYWIGLPEEKHEHCAVIGGDLANTIFGAASRSPDSLLGRAMRQLPVELLHTPDFRSAQVPAINGHGNARAIAKMYGLLAWPGNSPILSDAALDRATTLQWSGVEETMGHTRNMALGFILAEDSLPMGPGPRAFGHPGAGGSIGFADRDRGLGVCFTTNTLYAGHGLNPRMVDLCNAIFRASDVG